MSRRLSGPATIAPVKRPALALLALTAIGTQLAAAAGPDQLAGRGGCIATGAAREGCAPARGLDGTDAVTVSRDGRYVYTASEESDGVAVLSRRRSGRLRQLPGRRGCVTRSGREGCTDGRALGGAYAVALPRDGRHAYVPGQEDNSLVVLARNRRSGAVRQLDGAAGCLGEPPGCGPGRGLRGAFGATVSRDGRFVYTASEFSDAVAVFARDRSTGELTQLEGELGCVSLDGKNGCTAGRGLDGATSVVLSPDSRNAYAAGSDGVALGRVPARSPERRASPARRQGRLRGGGRRAQLPSRPRPRRARSHPR